MYVITDLYYFGNTFRGVVKLNFFQKSEKNSEVGGWVKPQLGFLFFGEMLCFLCCFCRCTCFQKKFKKWIGGWVGGVWTIQVFFRIFRIF